MKSPLELLKDQQDMEDHFRKRTAEHVGRVKANAAKCAAAFPDIGPALLEQVSIHDDTKYNFPEFFPYLHITWKYKKEADGEVYEPPADMAEKMHGATVHHVRHNKHHPEYWDPDFDENSLDPKDRDGVPERMVNGQMMDRVSIAEMVCDWIAMSLEKSGKPDATAWANMNINKRWKFTDQQVYWIWEFHEFFKNEI